MKNKPILLVAGEPKSIFFEIFFKAIKKNNFQSPLVLICCKNLLQNQMKKHNFNKIIKIIEINKIQNIILDNRKINVININLKKSKNKITLNKLSNKYIEDSFDAAFKLIKSGFTYKFINGPINKKTFLNKKFLGITEFISKKFNENKVGMLIYNKELSVSPITTHIPIKLVSKKINRKLIEEKISILNSFFKKILKIKPKIAVTGINPHCETILNYNEDEKIISPAIKTQKKNGIDIKGPYPADTIFLKKNREKFDVILGIYHDQVLGPFKTLYEYDAINITMGLPFLRVTPDHGPNQRMVGKNNSNPQSLIKALKFLDSK